MPDQNPATDMTSIEAISVVFAAVLVWLSALVQNLSNASERSTKYVMSDRSVSPPLQGYLWSRHANARQQYRVCLDAGAACGRHPHDASHDLDHTTIAEPYIGARIVCSLSD